MPGKRFGFNIAAKIVDRVMLEALNRYSSEVVLSAVYHDAERDRYCFDIILDGVVVRQPAEALRLPITTVLRKRSGKRLKLSDGTKFTIDYTPGNVSIIHINRVFSGDDLDLMEELEIVEDDPEAMPLIEPEEVLVVDDQEVEAILDDIELVADDEESEWDFVDDIEIADS